MIFDVPKISVVLACFNGVSYIEDQINSVLAQSLPPSEIIVCDDGSTDGTIEILQKFESDNNIKLVLNKQQLGVSANFKKAVSIANAAHYIAFCDQDDIWLPNKLAVNIKEFEQMGMNISNANTPCLVYSDLIFMNEAGEVINHSFYAEMGLAKFEHCFDTALFGSLLLGCTLMINPAMRTPFLAMPENKIFYHDAWISLIGFGIGKVAFIKEPLVRYRLHGNNLSMPNFKPRNRFVNLATHLISLPFKSSYLAYELVLAKAFSSKYNALLSTEKQLLLSNFLSLDNKLHYQKKWAFEKAFYSKWIKRF
jgi:glycosyltransferase involved in cell wall biosynthesis